MGEEDEQGPSILVCHRASLGDFGLVLAMHEAAGLGLEARDHGVVFVTAGELLTAYVRFGESPLPLDKRDMDKVRDYRLR